MWEDQLPGLVAAPPSRPQDPWHYHVLYEHFIWGKTSSFLGRANQHQRLVDLIKLVNPHYDLVVDQASEDWERGRESQELGHMQWSWGWWGLKWACCPSKCLKALEI